MASRCVGEGWLGHLRSGASVLALLGALTGCGAESSGADGDAIVAGAVLPFTGKNATIAQNIERAMLLAVEDVNRAGGVGGRKLRLKVRDSNSGSQRGLGALLSLLYDGGIRYLIGPEENALASEILRDIKALDVFNILPGYASPSVERKTTGGAWLRLAPTPLALGCSYSELARRQGVGSANAIIVQDDYYQAVASEFFAEFFDVGGKVLPSVTIKPSASSYSGVVAKVSATGAERTVLFADPTTAAAIVTEWAIGDYEGSWILGPTLNTPGFLPNVPLKSLNAVDGLSPTLSLASECENMPGGYQGPVQCQSSNAQAFREHFARRWDGELPFPAAHFYYDAVVLLAMGLQYADAEGESEPRASKLHELILELTNESDERRRWDELPELFEALAEGRPMALVGAAAEYQFDRYGAAQHAVFDTWQVDNLEYVTEGNLQTRCLQRRR